MKKILFTLAFGSLMAVSASAAALCSAVLPLPINPAATADNFCSSGSVTFGLFSVTEAGGAIGADVFVSAPANDGSLQFQITKGGPAYTGDIKISYKVDTAITGLTLGLGSNGGNVSILENACINNFCGLSGSVSLASLFVNNASLFDSKTFASTVPVYITKDIQLSSSTGAPTTISDFINGHTSAVPEPGSMALLGSGLLGLGMIARRRAQK